MPTLPELVGLVLLDDVAAPRDPVRQIAAAERIAGELNVLGDSLVGFFVELARAEGCSWTDIGAPRGLSRQGAQQRYAPMLAHLTVDDLVSSGVLQRFGDQALTCLRHAETRAARLGHDAIDSTDLLLAILDDPAGVAGAVIRALDADPSAIRAALEQQPDDDRPAATAARSQPATLPTSLTQPATGPHGPTQPTTDRGIPAQPTTAPDTPAQPTTAPEASRQQGMAPDTSSGQGMAPGAPSRPGMGPDARRAIDGAVAEAHGHLVAVAHLFLGILRAPGSRAGQVLTTHGITRPAALAQILGLAGRPAQDPA